MKDLGDQLRDAAIESRRIARELERLWNRYYEVRFGRLAEGVLEKDLIRKKGE